MDHDAASIEMQDGEKKAEGSLFKPPLYRQRYLAVAKLLQDRDIKKVLDIGCAECKFLRHLKNTMQTLEYIAGLDIDRALLEQYRFILKPCVSDYICQRSLPLKTSLLCGSIGKYDSRLVEFQALTMIEVIEHLELDILERSMQVIFSEVKPAVVIMTTPNVEYNVLFPGCSGMRHWDHKFEWTRQEFQSWCVDLASSHGYRVEFSGIGDPPEGSDVGCCSQLALFERSLSRIEAGAHTSNVQCYNIIAEHTFPYKQVEGSIEEQILYAAVERIKELAYADVLYQRQHGEEYNEEFFQEKGSVRVQVPLDTVVRFTDVRHLCTGGVDMLRSVLENADIELNTAKTAAVYTLKLEDYFHDFSDSESSSSNQSETEILSQENVNDGEDNYLLTEGQHRVTQAPQFTGNCGFTEDDWDEDPLTETDLTNIYTHGFHCVKTDSESVLQRRRSASDFDDDDDDNDDDGTGDGSGDGDQVNNFHPSISPVCSTDSRVLLGSEIWDESPETAPHNSMLYEAQEKDAYLKSFAQKPQESYHGDDDWCCDVGHISSSPAYRLFSKKDSPDGLAYLVECHWPGCKSWTYTSDMYRHDKSMGSKDSLCDICKQVFASQSPGLCDTNIDHLGIAI